MQLYCFTFSQLVQFMFAFAFSAEHDQAAHVQMEFIRKREIILNELFSALQAVVLPNVYLFG